VDRSQLRTIPRLPKFTNCAQKPNLKILISTDDPQYTLHKFKVQKWYRVLFHGVSTQPPIVLPGSYLPESDPVLPKDVV
jgi:hypothetical protein